MGRGRDCEFAKNYKLVTLQSSVKQVVSVDVLRNARTDLNCMNYDSCVNYCNTKENISRCKNFAVKYSLPYKKEATKEVKNCTDEKECREYCQKYPQDCQVLEKNIDSTSGKEVKPDAYIGPLGCKTDKECNDFCKKSPEECPGYPIETDSTKASSFGLLEKIAPQISKSTLKDNFEFDKK